MRTFLLFITFIICSQSYSQNIGIGTLNPVGRLQLNHNSQFSPGILLMDSAATASGIIRFKNINSTSFIQISGYSGGPVLSEHQYLDIKSESYFIATFKGNGMVGIGTIEPTTKLDVVGDIRSTNLTGTGFRPVFADDAGRLVTGPTVTSYVNVSPRAFTKQSSTSATSMTLMPDVGYLEVGATDVIGAHVNLPNGAKITEIRFVGVDNSATKDLEVSLIRGLIYNSGYNFVARFFTSGNSLGIRSFTATPTASFSVVDNFNYSYSVEIRPASGGSWDSNNLAFKGFVITYTY